MEDIVLNGVSINDLKAKQKAIGKDVAKFMSDSLEQVTSMVKEMVESQDEQEIDSLASKAHELLSSVRLVSGVSGVSFFLPYYEEYAGFGDDEVLSQVIENTDNDLIDAYSGPISSLRSLLWDMEGDTRNWHSSTC